MNHRKPWGAYDILSEIKRLEKEKLEWEEDSFNILKEIKKIKKSKTYGSKRSLQRVDSLVRSLHPMRNRHYNLRIRIEKLEWDYRNIVEVLDKNCRYDDCDCNKINIIIYPKGSAHYAKEECSKCGRYQKHIPYPSDLG
tara:strand:- start:1560 stop:1976 length:417 start_codon:yes stop_codon:yes gene_type:complete